MRGTLRKRGDTWTWQLKHQDPSRSSGLRYETRGGYRTKREAEAALQVALAAHDPANPAEPSKLPLATFVHDEWLPSLHSLKPSTVNNYRVLFDAYVLPTLGQVRLRDLTSRHLEQLYAKLRTEGRRQGPGGLSESSVHHVHVAISKAMSDAVESGLVATNPAGKVARRVKPRMATAPEMKVWNAEQVQQFLSVIEGERMHACIGFALDSFLRRGELCGLRWSDVDLTTRQVSVRRNRVAVGSTVQEGTTKGKRARTLTIDHSTVAALKRWKATQNAERLAWGEAWTDSGYVFTREDGHPWHPQMLRTEFARLVRSSGLPLIRFHDLRHTGATLALEAGVSVKVVSERLGHSSTSITEDIYSHVTPNMQAAVATVMGALVWGPGSQDVTRMSAPQAERV